MKSQHTKQTTITHNIQNLIMNRSKSIHRNYIFKPLGVCLMLFIALFANAQGGDSEVRRMYDSQRYVRDMFLAQDSMNGTTQSFQSAEFSSETAIANNLSSDVIQPKELVLAFHILHTQDESFAQQLISTQVSALNRDFNNQSWVSTMANDPQGNYLSRAVSAQINFSLATVDNSNLPEGIVSLSDQGSNWIGWDQMKSSATNGSDPIRSSSVINIWVCNLPDGKGSYGSSPYLISDKDGIVIDARFFGNVGDNSSRYNEGKTLTHLVANYLGLLDLWNRFNRCGDDYVMDTPIHNAPNEDVPIHKHRSLCPGNPLEMTMNFMDCTPDALQVMFTEGQVKRMHAVIDGLRPDLLTESTQN